MGDKIMNHAAVNPATDEQHRGVLRLASDEMVHPLFILALPRSFSSVVCAMLGQHPQMYGLPEMQLFGASTLTEWWTHCSHAPGPMAHGTLRAVAQLFFGNQTEQTVRLARGWLWRRSYFTTGFLLEVLAERVHPSILVEKSARTIYRLEFMQRAYTMFPQARFIHLVRHPRGYCDSLLKFIKETEAAFGPRPRSNWALQLASHSFAPTGKEKRSGNWVLVPERGWHALNMNICKFLKSLPDDQKLIVRGEDLLRNPDGQLPEVARWIGLRTDKEAIEAMKHPERSPYASYGPPGARFGNDRFFLENPVLRPDRAKPHRLEGPVGWYADGRGFSAQVKRLANRFGYD